MWGRPGLTVIGTVFPRSFRLPRAYFVFVVIVVVDEWKKQWVEWSEASLRSKTGPQSQWSGSITCNCNRCWGRVNSQFHFTQKTRSLRYPSPSPHSEASSFSSAVFNIRIQVIWPLVHSCIPLISIQSPAKSGPSIDLPVSTSFEQLPRRLGFYLWYANVSLWVGIEPDDNSTLQWKRNASQTLNVDHRNEYE